MSTQASTSSGAMDQRRKDALKAFRDVRIGDLKVETLIVYFKHARKCGHMRLSVQP
jgi:hypothetical protein